MKAYLNMIKKVLSEGHPKNNRTGVRTLSVFGHSYKIDISSENFPLLTTKDMSGYIWESLIAEFLWYLSGESHVRTLSEQSGIWDNWADEDGNLETSYGRFWRRFPVPEQKLQGEAWTQPGTDEDQFLNIEDDGGHSFDQIAWIRYQLKNNPLSRRLVLNTWHPANAAASKLPPCHFAATFNVQCRKEKPAILNCHLHQRSGDLGLGIPFNIAHYSLLTILLARHADLEPGVLFHTIDDLHIYVGDSRDDPQSHLEALEAQLEREPKNRPVLQVADKAMDDLEFTDFELQDYDPHPRLKMKVAP